MISTKPILVTGLNRSGTTWVGHMLDLSPSIGYIHEPFNLSCHRGICDAPFTRWFTYVTDENEQLFYSHIKNTLEFRYNLLSGFKATRSFRSLPLLIRTFCNTAKHRYQRVRPLMKDPVAIFSAEWLASRFDMDVVVMIRHPAAYVSSIKRLNWGTVFVHLRDQELLMRDHLHPFENEISKFASENHDIVDNAILSWKVMIHVIHKYMQQHTDWLFLRHEDISLRPIEEFRSLYGYLGLDFVERFEETIIEHCDTSNSNQDTEPFNIRRNSKSNITVWKERLSKDEINRVKEELGEIAYQFYDEKYW
jgi:hypothetical protein